LFVFNEFQVDVHNKISLLPETLYRTISIIDRYLERNLVRTTRLQLVGVAAFHVACKHEKESNRPEINDLVYFCDDAFSDGQIRDMEVSILRAVGHTLLAPTVHTFLCRFLKEAEVDIQVQLCFYLAEIALQEYCMLEFAPSVIAASIVHIARCTAHKPPDLVEPTRYSAANLRSCLAKIKELMADPTAATNWTSIRKKYKWEEFNAFPIIIRTT